MLGEERTRGIANVTAHCCFISILEVLKFLVLAPFFTKFRKDIDKST